MYDPDRTAIWNMMRENRTPPQPSVRESIKSAISELRERDCESARWVDPFSAPDTDPKGSGNL